MPTSPVDLITVSRDYGAGGSELASVLGHQLGWPVLDHDLVHLVAERLELEDATVARLDEHPPGWLARLASALLIAPPEAPVSIETTRVLSPDAVAGAAHHVIVEAAQRPPLIVVDHGSQCIFADRPGTLHLRLVAPLDQRLRRLGAEYGWNETTAAAQAQRMDRDRLAYVQRYYHHDWRDPLLYHMTINTGVVPVADAAALIVARVHRS